MKIPSTPFRASAVLYVLVVMAVGGVVLAAWIHLIANRVEYSDRMQTEINRRIALQNGRALATQFFLQNVLPASVIPSYGYGEVPDNWGAFYVNIAAMATPARPQLANDWPDGISAGLNPFSTGGNRSYSVDYTVELQDGGEVSGNLTWPGENLWTFQTRARSSLFGYDLFTAHIPGSIQSFSGLAINGAARLWSAASGVTALQFHTDLETDPPPSNFALSPITSGNAGAYWGYDGTLDNVNNSSGLNSLSGKFITSPTEVTDEMLIDGIGGSLLNVDWDGAGNVTINLGSLLSSNGTRIVGHADKITIVGQLPEGLPLSEIPFLIIYLPTGNESTVIEFSGDNDILPVSLGIAGNNASVTFRFLSSGTWRLAATLEDAPMNFDLTGDLSLIGGIRTNREITISGGQVSIFRDTGIDDESLDVLTGWLESTKQ